MIQLSWQGLTVAECVRLRSDSTPPVCTLLLQTKGFVCSPIKIYNKAKVNVSKFSGSSLWEMRWDVFLWLDCHLGLCVSIAVKSSRADPALDMEHVASGETWHSGSEGVDSELLGR